MTMATDQQPDKQPHATSAATGAEDEPPAASSTLIGQGHRPIAVDKVDYDFVQRDQTPAGYETASTERADASRRRRAAADKPIGKEDT
jgi:hypothetical protein